MIVTKKSIYGLVEEVVLKNPVSLFEKEAAFL